MLRITFACLLVIGLCIVVAGCTHERSPQDGASVFTVRDDMDRKIRFREHPSRIVSLAPSITECMYLLEADSMLIGVTSLCDFPPEAASKMAVGDLLVPDMERIISLQPDLVLLSVEGNRRETFDQLRRLGLKVFVSNPRSLAGISKAIRDLSAIVGREKEARRFAQRHRRVLSESRKRYSSATAAGDSLLRVLMVIDTAPLIVAGRDSFIHELITAAGGVNAAAALRGAYPVLGREDMLATDADVILLPDDLQTTAEQLLDRFPEWIELPAISDGCIVRVDPDLFMRPGPRALEGLRQLSRILHPDSAAIK